MITPMFALLLAAPAQPAPQPPPTPAPAAAEVIYLVNGDIIHGELVSANNTPTLTDPVLVPQGNANDRIRRMRSMIGGNNINGPILQSFTDRLDIRREPEGRIHFRQRALLPHRFFGQHEMMWTGFRGHPNSVGLGLPGGLYCLRRTDMRNMQMTVCCLGQCDIPFYHAGFRL